MIKRLITAISTTLLLTTLASAQVPLPDDLQKFISNESEYWQVSESLVYAVIEVESNFQIDIISKTDDYGLMQINKVNHKDAYNCFGYTDLLDPKQNLSYGIYKLGMLYNMYEDTHKALMVYNQGGASAKRSWSKGITTSSYSRKVLNKYQSYKTTIEEVEVSP